MEGWGKRYRSLVRREGGTGRKGRTTANRVEDAVGFFLYLPPCPCQGPSRLENGIAKGYFYRTRNPILSSLPKNVVPLHPLKGSSDAGQPGLLCANCGRPVDAEFCSHCGEKIVTERDYSLLHVLREGIGLLFDFDFKFLRSVELLLRKPGFLTSEYWAGRRIRYTNPLQLLLLINIFYFFATFLSARLGYNIRVMFPALSDITSDRVFSHWALSAIQAKLLAGQVTREAYTALFDAELEQLSKSLVILLVPILALFLRLFYYRSERFFVEHLVPAAHLVGFYVLFWSLFMIFMGGLTKLVTLEGAGAAFFQSPVFRLLHVAPAFILGFYIFLSLRRTYEERIWLTAIKSLLFILVVIQVITNIYDFVLFWGAYYLV